MILTFLLMHAMILMGTSFCPSFCGINFLWIIGICYIVKQGGAVREVRYFLTSNPDVEVPAEKRIKVVFNPLSFSVVISLTTCLNQSRIYHNSESLHCQLTQGIIRRTKKRHPLVTLILRYLCGCV